MGISKSILLRKIAVGGKKEHTTEKDCGWGDQENTHRKDCGWG